MALSWGRITSGACVALIGAISVIGMRAARAEIHADFQPNRSKLSTPTSGLLASAQKAAFRSEQGDELRGWWLPGRNGAAVVLVHGTGADRSQLSPQAEVLAKAGYGVLLFDLPGHGESGGKVTWSQSEPNALHSALSFVRARGAQRTGVVGFSAGAMIALHEAMLDGDAQALVLEGALDTLDSAVLHDFRRLGPLTQWPAILATRWAGFRAERLGPLRPLHAPVLFVSGGRDEEVPASVSQSLFARVQAPKEHWVIEGAAHGDYQQVAGAEFDNKLVEFFDKALKGPKLAWRAPSPP